MVLKRLFIGDTGKTSHINCSGLLGDSSQQTGMIVLLRRWFWNSRQLGHGIFGRAMAYIEIFQGRTLCIGMVALQGLTWDDFNFGRGWLSLKGCFCTISTLGRSSVLERLLFNNFHSGRMWWSSKDLFGQLLLLEDVVVLKDCFWTFHSVRIWWFGKIDLTISTLEGCGGLERTDFQQFSLWEGVVDLKGLIGWSHFVKALTAELQIVVCECAC